MLYSALIVLPIILSYSLYIEWSMKTSHQLLTLPVPRYMALSGKYLAVASVGIALVIVITVFQHIYEVRLLAEFPKRFFIANPFIFAFSETFSIIWLLGMVSLVYALLLFLRRLDLWVGMVFFGLLFALSVWSLKAMKPFLYDAAGIDEWLRVVGYGMYRNEYAGLIDSGWLFVLGSLYLFAGLYLFHHRGES